MSMEIEIKRPDITADTDILSDVTVTDDEGNKHEASFQGLLLSYGQQYLEEKNIGETYIFLIDDFEERAIEEGTTYWDTFEKAFLSKHWSTTHWNRSVLTRIEPMDLGQFQNHSKYFTWDVNGHLVFLEDELTVAAWLESKFIVSKDEKIDFVKWCFEEGRIK